MPKTTGTVIDENAVRKSWERGHKTIMFNGRQFVMKLQVKYWKDPETQERYKEEWITVRPMDGGLTPCASIERKNNSRAARR